MEEKSKEKIGRAIIVGGSIAGLACGHALVAAGWHVSIIEKSTSAPSGSPTGAGLGLDPLSRDILARWIPNSELITESTFPLTVDLNQATDSERKLSRTLARDDKFNFRAAHWADLHSILQNALPPELVFYWGHQFLSLEINHAKSEVMIKARDLSTGEVVQFVADLLVAADGSLSSIRQTFLPNFKLRYAGYYAWRGIFDFSGNENSETVAGIFRAYPELGDCLYFDLAQKTHSVFYELKGKRLNWVWFINGPEPELKGNSVTMKVSKDMLYKMHEDAGKVWVPELAKLMRETPEPFINVIYDADPLPQLCWQNAVVLVGDAAHPTTPHGVRSTNMSILDAGVLGRCLARCEPHNLGPALAKFQSIRLPVVSEQVLHARKLGRVKQGLEGFDPMTATPEECLWLQQRNMPYFESVYDV